MTASKRTKSAGLKSLRELSKITNASTEALNRWYKNYPERFEALLLGALVIKAQKNNEEHF